MPAHATSATLPVTQHSPLTYDRFYPNAILRNLGSSAGVHVSYRAGVEETRGLRTPEARDV